MNSNVYKPLNHCSREFRLVTILPEPRYHSPVVCELHQSNLDQGPQYAALSYAWTNYGLGQQAILLNKQAFNVTARLNFALRRLRSPHERRTFWIDAICINQTDNIEKSHQVGQMKHIYENAQGVFVYLGDGPDICAAIVRLLETLAGDSKNCDYAYIARNLAKLYPDSDAWEDLFMFFIDEWWKRAWIVQEIVVAKRVTFLLGRAEIMWNKVEQAMGLLRSIDNYNHSPTTALAERSSNMSHVWYRRLEQSLAFYPFHLFQMRQSFAQDQKLSLLQILVDNRTRQSSDPRDKIFAFLGLAKDASPETLVPDYTKSVQQIYKELVRDVIRRQQDLEILRYAALQHTSSDLPSWCPGWRTAEWRVDFLNIPQFKLVFDSDTGAAAPIVSFSEDLNILNAKGFIVDAIETILAGHLGPFEQFSKVQNMAVSFDKVEIGDTMLFRDQFYSPLFKAIDIWIERLQTKNTDDPVKSHSPPLHTRHKFGSLEEEDKERLNRDIDIEEPNLHNFDYLEGNFWKHAITAVYTGAFKPFQTTRGRIGFAIPDARDGDVICHLLGSTNPFILRMGPGYWTLVGQCTFLSALKDIAKESGPECSDDVSLELVEFDIH